MLPVILSGGSGTRLWPVSRSKFPKQFCELFDESLQIKTAKRLSHFGVPWVVTSKDLKDFTRKQLAMIGMGATEIILEPTAKNTAPAIALLCKILDIRNLTDEVVGVFPADHLIENEEAFKSALERASELAETIPVVTLGVTPTYPATGYGYIQTSSLEPVGIGSHRAFRVERFHEKPTITNAESFVEMGNYFWNAGVFVFKVSSMIQIFKNLRPEIWNQFNLLKHDLSNLKDIYSELPAVSIDYAILERLKPGEISCIPIQVGWSDVGSWDAVAEVYDSQGLRTTKPVEVQAKSNFVFPYQNKTYAIIGVDELIVVDTNDALLIAKKGDSQAVRDVVEQVRILSQSKVHEHSFEERPWGKYEVLADEPNFKTKRILIDPFQQISYQSHSKREEHWIIVRGTGEVILNDEVTSVRYGSYVKIPIHAKHRIRNTSELPLEFVEIQVGDYFGEEDIVRYADDFDRQ